MFLRRRRRRGPKPDLFEGTYERDTDVSLFVPDGPPEGWWIEPDELEGTPGLEPDDRGRVRARLRLSGWVSGPGHFGPLGMYTREVQLLHVHVIEPIRPARQRRVGYVAYTLDAPDLETAAAIVGPALDTTLHAHHSPMIGPWYADVEPAAIARPPRKGEPPIVRVMLTTNDPEPGVVPPHDPSGRGYVLSVLTLPGLEDQTVWSLAEAGIRCTRVI